MKSKIKLAGVGVLLGLAFLLVARPAAAQNSSLYGASQQRQPLSLADSSWIYQRPEEPQVVKLHDLVTVIVEEKSRMSSGGQMDRKKQAHGGMKLKEWIKMWGGHLGNTPFSNGEPSIRGELDNKLRSQADLDTADLLTFHIACEVVDIRPNGNLVIEGHRTIKNNEEEWNYSLRGEFRPGAIKPNNTVLSEDIANMQIDKREKGHVRDGYRRGWALEWLDKWQPF